ncbi:hypothetical protein BH23CHL2_BH23CHL2_09870 [soil metagenome]
MASTPKTYTRDSEVAALVAELLAAGNTLRITVGGEDYTLKLDVDDDDHSPSAAIERLIAGIQQSAGSWKDEDTEAFLDYIYRRRSLPPRPAIKL